MEPCTYFIVAIVLFLTALGAMSHTAALAIFAVAAITLAGGIYTKFLCR